MTCDLIWYDSTSEDIYLREATIGIYWYARMP